MTYTYFQTICPMCRRTLRVRSDYHGRQIICNHCGHRGQAIIPRKENGQGSASPPPQPETLQEAKAVEVGLTQERGQWLEGEIQRIREQLANRDTEHAATIRQLQEAQDQLADRQEQLQVLQEQLEQAEEQRRRDETVRLELESERTDLNQLLVQFESLRSRADTAERLLEERRAAENDVTQLRTALSDLERSLGERSLEFEEARGRWEVEREEMRAQWDRDRQDLLNEAKQNLEKVREGVKREERRAAENDVKQLRTALSDLERSLGERSLEFEEARCRWEVERGEMRAQWDRERQDLLNEAEQNLEKVREGVKVEAEKWQDQLKNASRQFDRDLANLRGEIDRLSREAENSRQERDTAREQVKVVGREREQLSARLEELSSSYRQEEPYHQTQVKRSDQVTAEDHWNVHRAPAQRESIDDSEDFDSFRIKPRRRIPIFLMIVGWLTVGMLCLMPYLLFPITWYTYVLSITLGLAGVTVFSYIEGRLIGANPVRYALLAVLMGGAAVALFLVVSRHFVTK
jgi:VIT1/CCC1 family predicted Fe2+/Mn2+ transporter